jgi:hypothetical protein
MSDMQSMQRLLTDLEVDFSDMLTDPNTFIKRVVSKSRELAAELDKKNNLGEIESRYKANCYRNKEAADRAEELKAQIMSMIFAETPEVIANLLPMFAELTGDMANEVRTASFRASNVSYLPKRMILDHYIRLKKMYEAYINFAKLMYPDELKKVLPPTIPPKTGNYGTGENHKTLYHAVIDGETYINPYEAGRILGVEVNHYMDIVDAIRAATDGEINGRKVDLQEF